MAQIHAQSAFVTTQPVVINPFHQFTDSWRVDLCECCNDISQCCYAYWCFPCFVLALAGKIDEPCVSCFCLPNALGVYRMKVRATLRIKGDSCNDYCVVCCCPFCAGLQMRNELTQRGLR
ncbi:unnamed protein product [Rotaria sordida]|uniref:Cornifelin n=1 Tax=Rotaria sordida TaxID=392033 RepID=A0A814R614_9BILA|nr:unnamed protein product [Rotaria sordida]CAF1352655.1 unnamed protein product [Rotaria sordida]